MLNILYQFNEKYVPYAGVSIVSLLDNNKECDSICIYLLCENVSTESKVRLRGQIEKYNRQSVIIDASDVVEKIKKLGINSYRNSYATNIKMFVNDFIPDTVGRLIYIDCDTIVEGDISELASIEIDGCPIAMSLDSLCKNHKKEVGFDKNDSYFNGGMILYDMKSWHDERCEEKLVDLLCDGRTTYMAPDQDMLNIALKGRIYDLGPKYNLQPMHFVYSYKLYYKYFGFGNYYSQECIDDAVESPKIIHTFRYLGQFPWHKDSLHPCTDRFDKYLAMSDWKDYQKQVTEKNDFVFKFERWMYKVFPHPLFIMIFKMFYELFLWKANIDSKRKKNNARM